MESEKIDELEARIEMLELYSHPPIDWERRIKNLEKMLKKIIKNNGGN
tara:strand:- start:325 stop:468 length:144 start_codon:yes stop_codon:yes gene_type:complete